MRRAVLALQQLKQKLEAEKKKLGEQQEWKDTQRLTWIIKGVEQSIRTLSHQENKTHFEVKEINNARKSKEPSSDLSHAILNATVRGR